jgi:integrase
VLPDLSKIYFHDDKTQTKKRIRPLKRENGQGSIYLSGPYKNQYKASIHDVRGKRITRTFKSRKDAENWLHEQRIARERGESTYAADPKSSVKEFLDFWLEQNKGKVSANTYRNYKSTITHRIAPHIGHLNASRLSPFAVEKLFSTLKASGYKAGTVKGAYRVLAAAYNYAIRMETFVKNPMEKVPMPKMESSPTQHIPKDDFDAIYREAALNPYTFARIYVGMVLGLRPGEIYGLLWNDLNWNESTLKVERQVQRVKGNGLVFTAVKQGGVRFIHLTPYALQILADQKTYLELQFGEARLPDDLIFPNTVGKPLDAKRDAKWWSDLLKRAGVRNYQLYQMRKSAITYMGRNTDPKTLMDFSGHSQISTVMRSYIFSDSHRLADALQRVEQNLPIVSQS